jgi:hypothetical protein
MNQYSRPRAEERGALVGDGKICADCGHLVSAGDRYCAGCGVPFAGAPARVAPTRALPGFQYHLIQGLGWGLGFALAGAIVSVIVTLILGAFAAQVIHGWR